MEQTPLDLPICHGWPITDDDHRAVTALAEPADDEVAHARRAHRLIWQWQQGRCAICGDQARLIEPGRWDRDGFVLDHDHVTALVRGWLCQPCNASEPHADREFARYRSRPPAVMLGVSVRYVHPWRGLAEPQPWLDPSTFDPTRSAAYRLQGRFARHIDPDTAPR